MTTAPLIHFAGLDVQIGQLLRQRCAWCGHLLIDYDLGRVAVRVEDLDESGGFRPATWSPGALVLVDGGMTALVNHQAGDPIPDGTCHDART